VNADLKVAGKTTHRDIVLTAESSRLSTITIIDVINVTKEILKKRQNALFIPKIKTTFVNLIKTLSYFYMLFM